MNLIDYVTCQGHPSSTHGLDAAGFVTTSGAGAEGKKDEESIDDGWGVGTSVLLCGSVLEEDEDEGSCGVL